MESLMELLGGKSRGRGSVSIGCRKEEKVEESCPGSHSNDLAIMAGGLKRWAEFACLDGFGNAMIGWCGLVNYGACYMPHFYLSAGLSTRILDGIGMEGYLINVENLMDFICFPK